MNYIHDLIKKAYESEDRNIAKKIAKKAIAIDPNNEDAYICLGIKEDVVEKSIAAYKKAIEIIKNKVSRDIFANVKKGGIPLDAVDTYIQAMAGLSAAYCSAGMIDEMVKSYKGIMELDNSDSFAVGTMLSKMLLVKGCVDGFKKLMEYMPNDTAEYAYNKALCYYMEYGISEQSNDMLMQAFHINRYIMKYMLYPDNMPEVIPDRYYIGTEEEAIVYIGNYSMVWFVTKGALDWMNQFFCELIDKGNDGIVNLMPYINASMGIENSSSDRVFSDDVDQEFCVRINTLPEIEYEKIPIFKQVKYFLKLIRNEGEIKLTKNGYLPQKIVKRIFEQRMIKEPYDYFGKRYNERDIITVHITNILVELAGLYKKRHNKISLTKTGAEMLSDNKMLFSLIFRTFVTKLNWAYFDGCLNEDIGQYGFEYSLILLSKYGDKKRNTYFYAKKYFEFFPYLLNASNTDGFYDVDSAYYCYSFRTFYRFLYYFGLVNVKRGKVYNFQMFVKKTALFDKLVVLE